MIKLYSRYSLLKRIVQSRKLINKLVKFPFSEAEIIVYKEHSPESAHPGTTGNPEEVKAHDLFNRFTADVIKEKTVFIR